MATNSFLPDSLPFNDPKLTRKIAIVTGANNGIGYYTALHLYLHGWSVYMACRNLEKAQAAALNLTEEANVRALKLPQSKPGAVYLLKLDLVDLSSVAAAVKELKSKEDHLDLLINNAGVMALPFELSVDGYEIQLQTNHMGPYLFSRELVPLLLKSQFSPRVIFVSSIGHYFVEKTVNYDKHYNHYPNIFWTWMRYGRTKLANIHSATILSEAHPDILALSVYPGLAFNTGLLDYWTHRPLLGWGYKVSFQIIGRYFGVSNEEGSIPTLKAALDASLAAPNDNGTYIGPYGTIYSPSHQATDKRQIAHTKEWTDRHLSQSGYYS